MGAAGIMGRRRHGLADAAINEPWVVAGGLHGPAGYVWENAARWVALVGVLGWLLAGIVTLRTRRDRVAEEAAIATSAFERPATDHSDETPSRSPDRGRSGEPTVT